jgi:hypothetical protein
MTREKIIKSLSKDYVDVIVDRTMLTSFATILGEVSEINITSGSYTCSSIEDIFSAPANERLPIEIEAIGHHPSEGGPRDRFSVNITQSGVRLYCTRDTPQNEERFNRLRKVTKDGFWTEKIKLYKLKNNIVSKTYTAMLFIGGGMVLLGFVLYFILGYKSIIINPISNTIFLALACGGSILYMARELTLTQEINRLPAVILQLDPNDTIPRVKGNISSSVIGLASLIFGSALTHFLDRFWGIISF